MKYLKFLFLICLPFLLTGCINYADETWLNADGSGKMTMEISISQQLLALMAGQGNSDPFSQENLTAPFHAVKGIKVEEAKTYNKDGNQVAMVSFEFSSFKALSNVNNSNGTPGFLGKIDLTKDKKGQLIFCRTITKMDLGSAKEAGENNDLAGQLSAAMLSGYNWKYTVHFPSKVISANTAKDNIDMKTNTVVWEVPLSTLSQSPQTMTATIQAPAPALWLPIIIIVAALLIIAVLALVSFKLTKKPAAA